MPGILDKKDLEAKADAIVERIHGYLDDGKKSLLDLFVPVPEPAAAAHHQPGGS